jgi:hypothetical protein
MMATGRGGEAVSVRASTVMAEFLIIPIKDEDNPSIDPTNYFG